MHWSPWCTLFCAVLIFSMLSFLRSERGLRRVRPWDVVCRFTVQGSLLKQTSKNNFNESSQKTNHITTTISLLPIPLETLIDTPWHWSKTDLNKQNISPDFHVAGIIDCLSEEHSIVSTRLHDYNELTDLKTGIYRCVHNLNGPWKKRKKEDICPLLHLKRNAGLLHTCCF